MSANALARWLQFAVNGQPAHHRSPRRRARRGPARNWRYRRWIRSLPSVVSGRPGCQACHTVNNGTSSKGSCYSCVPLTLDEHLEYDAGREAFEKRHGVRMAEIVRRLNHSAALMVEFREFRARLDAAAVASTSEDPDQ